MNLNEIGKDILCFNERHYPERASALDSSNPPLHCCRTITPPQITEFPKHKSTKFTSHKVYKSQSLQVTKSTQITGTKSQYIRVQILQNTSKYKGIWVVCSYIRLETAMPTFNCIVSSWQVIYGLVVHVPKFHVE